MTEKLTYGQLYEKLRELGFTKRYGVKLNGRQGEAFEHKTIPNALIVLPIRKPGDPVENFYKQSVLALLRAHDIVHEENLLLS